VIDNLILLAKIKIMDNNIKEINQADIFSVIYKNGTKSLDGKVNV
jgi:hypothetical protein